IAAIIVVAGAGCPLNDCLHPVRDLATQITESMNRTIDGLDTTMSNATGRLLDQSSAWQGTLQGLTGDLTNAANNLEAQIAQHGKDIVNATTLGAKEVEVQAARDAMNLEQQLLTDVRGVIDQVAGAVKD